MRVLIRCALLFAAAVLGACGPSETRDWRADLRQVRNDQRGRIDPLPHAPPPRAVMPLEIGRDPFRRDSGREQKAL